ncbi:hypothetical protein G4911_01895 [Aeromonas rivipollensis]|uniref:Uncharacterized protein n=1 Tax=Aeromonas rivipollensis TaxID=948519 RepID=A0AAW9Y5X3_9GAMM|nr:hypothetical protein [Aeromonas rivipollensis]
MLKKKLGGYKFGIEHALDLYASSFVIMPAEYIYEKNKLAQFERVIKKCHIYFIGYEPIIDFTAANQVGDTIVLDFLVANEERHLQIGPMPEDVKFIKENELHYLLKPNGDRFWFADNEIVKMLNSQPTGIHFEVKYIGQAYGTNGSRNALERLTKHETLQKISLKGVPSGYRLSLLLLEIEPNIRLVTAFTPNAKVTGNENERIKYGLDKLNGTSEAEQVSIFEAAMIKYFSPEYNKEFKNSFPSTNLKILQDCYKKDISAVFAQICIDEIPYKIFSQSVEAKQYHISKHDLQNDSERKVFFGV